MQYKNITDRNRWVVCSSVKQLIPPGGIVNLSHTDIRHAGGAMRFFESVHKAQEIADDLFKRSAESRGKNNNHVKPLVAPEPVAIPEKDIQPTPKPVPNIAEEVSKDIVGGGE